MPNTKVVNLNQSEYDVYIGRPSKWGNPYEIGKDGSRSEVIEKYRQWIMRNQDLMSQLEDLRGMRLGCFCHPKKCHGDVLVELLNRNILFDWNDDE